VFLGLVYIIRRKYTFFLAQNPKELCQKGSHVGVGGEKWRKWGIQYYLYTRVRARKAACLFACNRTKILNVELKKPE